MYTIERLQNLAEYLDVDSVDRILAEYFLSNLKKLSHLTLKKCIQDTGVSKASIHRFYSRGGFNNFKALTDVLTRELAIDNVVELNNDDIKLDVDNGQLNYLCNSLMNANKVMFYGKQEEVNCFDCLKYVLIKSGIKVSSLNLWNMEMIYNRIDRLNENDVLIVIDSSMKVQNMFEMSMNRSYLLNFERLKNAKFKCFYLGNSNCDEYFGFKNIKLKEENPLLINLLVFEIIKRIKKKGY